MTAHTPGPWTAITGRNGLPNGPVFAPTPAGARQVALACGDAPSHQPESAGATVEIMSANARLIAAAPDMLRVLTAAEHALRAYQFGNVDPSLAEQVGDAIKVVLDRAEGR